MDYIGHIADIFGCIAAAKLIAETCLWLVDSQKKADIRKWGIT
jgi:hypothetical protein